MSALGKDISGGIGRSMWLVREKDDEWEFLSGLNGFLVFDEGHSWRAVLWTDVELRADTLADLLMDVDDVVRFGDLLDNWGMEG